MGSLGSGPAEDFFSGLTHQQISHFEAIERTSNEWKARYETSQASLGAALTELGAQKGVVAAIQAERESLVERAISEQDRLATAIVQITLDNVELRNRLDRLRAFKKYVHDRLDKAGVPIDPAPEKTHVHGCRIEGRIDWLLNDRQAISRLYTDLVKAK